ncbi:MAG: hypothetical protein KIT84_07630 [Labilithrix sp.]|nr:hypothetical protein [Labilithrix sp.]MCW5810866.1 hypothetical protein [Labilithrix sp.]
MTRRAMGPALVLACSLVAGRAGAAPSVAQCLDSSEQGQAMRDANKLLRARELLSTCASASCPGPVRASCGQWLKSVRERTPSVIVAVRAADDARDLTDASYRVDDGAAERVSGQPRELDPGVHAFHVRAPGHKEAEQSVVVNLGEKNRLVVVSLAPSGETTPASAAAAADAEKPPALAPLGPVPAPPSSSGFPRVPVAIGLGAVALGTLGTSIFLGLDARGDLADLRSSACGAAGTCGDGATDGIRTRLVVADVLLGTSIVAAAAAVWLWLSAPGR